MKADWFVPAPAVHVPPLARTLGIDRRIDRDAVAVTFDDGPHERGTPAMLEILAERGARATFFLVGEQVERRPAVAREIAAAGHEIALHGHRHVLLLRRTVSELGADLDRAVAVIEDATGLSPTVYRPPYGVFSSGALRLVRERGLRPLLWSAWGKDWQRGGTPASVARPSTRRLRAGDVVLLHDSDAYGARGSWLATAGALPSVLDAVERIGVPADAVTQST